MMESLTVVHHEPEQRFEIQQARGLLQYRRSGNELVLVHVCIGVPGHVARHLSKGVISEYYTEETAKVIDPVKALLANHNITNYTIDQRHGHAAEEILKAAEAAKVDLIVMGTHGHGLFGRALMGSVATKVVAETDISVLLVQ